MEQSQIPSYSVLGVWLEKLKFIRYCSILVTIIISVQSWTKSSLKLFLSYVFSFINCLYLLLYAYVQTLDVTGTKVYKALFSS